MTLAQLVLGENFYYKGIGTEVNDKEFIKWLKKSAEQEYPEALNIMKQFNVK